MKKVRLGIIGVGNMGFAHGKNVVEGRCPDFELTAIADWNPERLQWVKEQYPDTVRCFDDAMEMLNSSLIDACIVSVPHYNHPRFAMACMERGIHVMVEKPAGVYTLQVREMNEMAARHPEVVFAMMFNQRTNCVYRKMHELVHSGKYGRIRRTNWLITSWYRPQAYYDSGDWRATWSGEGGGVRRYYVKGGMGAKYGSQSPKYRAYILNFLEHGATDRKTKGKGRVRRGMEWAGLNRGSIPALKFFRKGWGASRNKAVKEMERVLLKKIAELARGKN